MAARASVRRRVSGSSPAITLDLGGQGCCHALQEPLQCHRSLDFASQYPLSTARVGVCLPTGLCSVSLTILTSRSLRRRWSCTGSPARSGMRVGELRISRASTGRWCRLVGAMPMLPGSANMSFQRRQSWRARLGRPARRSRAPESHCGFGAALSCRQRRAGGRRCLRSQIRAWRRFCGRSSRNLRRLLGAPESL